MACRRASARFFGHGVLTGKGFSTKVLTGIRCHLDDRIMLSLTP
jgi:hypothetical protein